mgnify:CR=1 FL=1
MTDRQRLEAIIAVVCKYLPNDGISRAEAMSQIIELVDPLPESSEQEPVAWVAGYKTGQCVIAPIDGNTVFPTGLALYTAPTKRAWVDLTTEEIRAEYIADRDKYFADIDCNDLIMIARAIEAKLKEKNHG